MRLVMMNRLIVLHRVLFWQVFLMVLILVPFLHMMDDTRSLMSLWYLKDLHCLVTKLLMDVGKFLMLMQVLYRQVGMIMCFSKLTCYWKLMRNKE